VSKAKIIPSHQQAQDIGNRAFGPGTFVVFEYVQARSNLTLFGAERISDQRRIWSQ
tara:strand:+ start:280 stop:447 length:168 start_codon:yes stop_codon:yes gene_type:complete